MKSPMEMYVRSDRAPVEPYFDAQGEHRKQMLLRQASDDLRDEIKSLFVRAEREHGLRPGDGVHLLLNNGVRS